MAIVAEFNVPGMTREQYDSTMAKLASEGLEAAEGRLYHVAAADGDGWFALDVWESEDRLNEFAQKLIPILASVGVTPPAPQVRPVHNIVE